MMAEEMVRFELGFRSGGSTGGTIGEAEWAKLESALRASSASTLELNGQDQRWFVRVDEIAYARRHESPRRLGFGG